MAVWNLGNYQFNIIGDDVLRSPWRVVTGLGERINNHWNIEVLPKYAVQQVGFVDMGLHTVAPHARDEDRLTLAENGTFVLNIRGVEHLDASPSKTVNLEVVGKKGFTTDGSFNSVTTNVGHHEIFYTGATRDSSLFTGVGWDQIRLIDNPLVTGTQYWAVVRRADGEVDAYNLHSGYRVRYEGGSTTWGNTSGRLNYGEVDETFLAARNRPAGDVWRPGNDVSETGDRGTFDNIDLSETTLTTYTDRFIAASFKSIHYATQNLHVGTAIVETFNPVNGDTTGGTQSASRDHITTNGNHHLLVNEETTVIDGHLRLYVRNNESGLYNRFNEVYLGTAAAEINANSYNTTSKNDYATVSATTGTGATPVLGTAMYGFGGNDSLTGGSDIDYLFGGTSTFTTIPAVLQGNVVTGGDGTDFFGVGNISTGVDGDVIMTTDFSARLTGTAPASTDPSGTLARTGAAETADLNTRVATDRLQDWTAGVDSLRVLANGTAIIDGLGTTNGAGGGYSLDLIGSDGERIDMSGVQVNNEGKIVARGLGGNDVIIGSDGVDWLYGNSGSDTVIAGSTAAGDGNDRFYYDTYSGRLFAGGFDAGDKVYLNKKVLEAITGTFIRSTEAANNLTANDTTLSGNPVSDTQDYAAAIAYDPSINFLHDVFYGPSGGLPANYQHTNGAGFIDGSDNYADISTAAIGGGMFAVGAALVATGLFAAAGYPLMAAGLALGAGGLAGGYLSWTKPHQHATYTGNITGNFLTVLTAQNNVDTTVAVDGNANIDNKGFLDFFQSADAGDGFTPAIQFTSLDSNTPINQFMAVHSDEETFIYWVYSRDAIVTNGEAVKLAEINGKLFAEDFAIYDGELDVYNYGTLTPIVIYTPSITSVGYDQNQDGDFNDGGDAVIAQDASVVLDGGGRFVIQGQFFRALGDQTDPFTTTAASATVTVAYSNHGFTTNDWVQITGATASNGIDFNGAYQITVINANTFTFTANKFIETTGVAGVTPGNNLGGVTSFGIPGNISTGSTIKVYDGVDRLDADPLTAGDQVNIGVSGNSFTLYDTRNLGTSLTQSPDGTVTFDSGDNRYEDVQGNPAYFSVQNGSSTVSVQYTNHGLIVGDSITITGATSTAGVTFNGTWVVVSVPSANQFTFTAAETANATNTNVGTTFGFTKVSAPVDVPLVNITSAVPGVLNVTMTGGHGMLTGDEVTFTSTFNANNYQYSANTPYSVTRIDDNVFSITSTAINVGVDTIPANVTFSVPNGGDQTFFLRDEKVNYFVEVTNADSGFEILSLQYNFTVGGGTTILNGGRGDDSIILSDESTALNRMGDGQIINIETINISSDANDSITLDLSNQTDGFEIYDSDASNSIIGSQGNDMIYGFTGNDTINAGAGNDSIRGGAGQDLIELNGGGNDQVQFNAADAPLDADTLYDTVNNMSAGDTLNFLDFTDRDGQTSRLMYEIADLGDNMTVASATELLVVDDSTVAAGGDLTNNIATALGSAFNLSGLDGDAPGPNTGGGSNSTSLFAVKSNQTDKWWVGTYLDQGDNDLLDGSEIAVFGLVETPNILNSFWQNTVLAPQALTVTLPASTVSSGGSAYTQGTTFTVGGLQSGNRVYYSLNGGTTWQTGAVDQTTINLNSGQANNVRVRQRDGDNYSPETTSGDTTITPVSVIWDDDSPTTEVVAASGFGTAIFTSLGLYRNGTTTVNGLELPYFRNVGFDPVDFGGVGTDSARIYFDFDDKASIDSDVWGPGSTSALGGKFEIVNSIKVHDLDNELGDYNNGLQDLASTWWYTDEKGRLTINTDDFDGETRSGADTRLRVDIDIPLAGGGTQNFVFDGYIDWANGIL